MKQHFRLYTSNAEPLLATVLTFIGIHFIWFSNLKFVDLETQIISIFTQGIPDVLQYNKQSNNKSAQHKFS
jgi:uncharacterized membrane protein YkgB